MEDSTDDDSLDTVPLAMRFPTKKAETDVAAPTARRRRRCSPGRSAAKPRGRGRKAASNGANKGGNSNRGRGRKARATAASSASVAAPAGASPKAGHGIQRRAGHSSSGTAEEKTLQDVTTDSEADIDRQADEYVSNILPDQAMVVYPDRNSGQAPSVATPSRGDSHECPEEMDVMSSPRRRGSRPSRAAAVRQRRRVAVEGDERVVSKVLPGRWSTLLPVGTVVRRPSTKLVQLVAQAINESPHQMLRVTHVYAALQNKYPYYKLLDKKDINSWKSSVRHALFQKWFIKLLPKASLCESIRPRSYFWGVNYDKRPREWQMPGARPAVHEAPAGRGEDQQDDDNESAMSPALHSENEAPTQEVLQENVPSACRVELGNTTSPPEPKWPPVHKQERPSGSCTINECLPGPSAPQALGQLGSPSSSCSLSNVDLWKQEFEELDCSQPSVGSDEAFQPSAIATTESTPSVSITMATQSTAASLVEAAVDSLEKPWQTQPGEHIVKLQPQDELPQQDIVTFQQALQEQQEQQQFQQMQQASIQGSQEVRQIWRDPATTMQGDTMMDFLTTTEPGRRTDIFGKFSPQASPSASFGAPANGTDEPLPPRPTLCWSPSSAAGPSAQTPAAVKQPPVSDTPPAPSQNKEAHSRISPEFARHLADVLRGYGQRSADYCGETVACLRLPQPQWDRMVRREIYKNFADPGGRITAILVTGQASPTPPASPPVRAEGEDEWGDDFLSAVQEDFLPSPPRINGYDGKSPPLSFGGVLKQEFLF